MGTYLSGADLSGALLDGVSLAGSDLRFATLRGAMCRATRFGTSQLDLADFRGADLQDAALDSVESIKGADFSHFRAALQHVDVVIVLGKDGERIAHQVEHAVRVTNLEEAVSTAAELATPQSMVLLSPACASMDMFKNYEHRGDEFRAAVEAHYGR